MEWVYFGFAVISLGSLALTAAGAAAAFRFFRVAPEYRPSGPRRVEGVSVLKPLKGVDASTRSNLESFFWLSYPKFELLFCVAEAGDPAAALARELMAAYPEVNARLFVGQVHAGPNPKINNLLNAYSAARYQTLLVSDSNIRVPAGYLEEMAAEISEQAMISSVVVGREAGNFTGAVEEVFLGGFYARAMILSLHLGKPCMMGKSMMFKREAMEQVGGLAALAPYLAEDFMAGEKFRAAGYPISLSHKAVTQVIGSPGAGEFWKRHLRWGRIRKVHAPLLFLVEPLFTNMLLGALLGSWAAAHFMGIPMSVAFAAYAAAWVACDALAFRAGGGTLRLGFPLHFLAREVLHLPLWVHIASGNRIRWKSGTWRLGGDGRLTAPSTGCDGVSAPSSVPQSRQGGPRGREVFHRRP